jgi:polygalacturonase
MIGTVFAVSISAGAAFASPTATANSSCTVTSYADVPAAVASCTAITIQNVIVPGNSTLDLSKLKTGTTVTFAGKTVSFLYAPRTHLHSDAV